jgi:type VI secretion system secreted protein Hcp
MAVDYFLKLDGVDGESADDKHKGEIDLESWSWGAAQHGSHGAGGGGGAGKVQVQDFQFVMKMNKASPRLMLACATGEHIPKAVLTCRKAGKQQQEYLKITMSDVLVSSYQTSGSAHGAIVPLEQISVNFAKVEMECKEQKADGSLGGAITGGYNVKENKKI